ncbi:MAG: M23 family metallopeptidase [Trueperaceae bacterium]|nr:M23 family metallopeptidase [Trueperaceae bacterium]
MQSATRSVKPGWIVLVVVAVYAIVMTVVARDARAEIRELRLAAAENEAIAAARSEPRRAPAGVWFPVPGASLPTDDAHLPGAPRAYRNGVSEGFDFYAGDAGVPIELGTPVVAAVAGTVTRSDRAYAEPDEAEWTALLGEVADGADASQLDRLRGRQLWIEGDDGRSYRYAHLDAIEPDLSVGDPVYRGQVVATAGNSGTDDGVRGLTDGVRVHFEIWENGDYFGAGLEPAAVRANAAALFVGP